MVALRKTKSLKTTYQHHSVFDLIEAFWHVHFIHMIYSNCNCSLVNLEAFIIYLILIKIKKKIPKMCQRLKVPIRNFKSANCQEF